ncbi:MAG TPA: chromosome partitioning protein ParB, partial [Rubrivivax sp.]|nr:chromosome partitioning protein ParB [Rubrivivax sp.]
QGQGARGVGRPRSAASTLGRRLQLSEPVQQMLMAGDLDMGHARALLALDGAQQISAANQVAGRKLSVREAERLVARVAAGAGRQAPLLRVKADKPREIVRLESALADALTAPVEIRVKKRTQRGERGEIAIRFDSLDELDALLDKLGVETG